MCLRYVRVVRLIVVAIICIVLGACATTSYSIPIQTTVPRTVKPPLSVNPWIGPHLPLFMAVLERQGFRVAQTEDPSAMQLRVDFDPNPWAMLCTVSLVQREQTLVMAHARNAAFGTVAFRSAAIANLAQSAATSFEAELKKAASQLTITDDTPVTAQGTQ